MTHEKAAFGPGANAASVVYVRLVRRDEIPAGEIDSIEGPLYAIHDQAGNRIGLAPDRALAFSAARQHQLTPVSVH